MIHQILGTVNRILSHECFQIQCMHIEIDKDRDVQESESLNEFHRYKFVKGIVKC